MNKWEISCIVLMYVALIIKIIYFPGGLTKPSAAQVHQIFPPTMTSTMEEIPETTFDIMWETQELLYEVKAINPASTPK